MRIALALVALASSARVCGNEEPPAPPPPAPVATTVSVARPPAAPAHGGTVVVMDDMQLELVVKGSGEVVAYPVIVAGAAVVPPAATIEVQVPVTSGPPRPVTLEWNPRVASFEGRVVGATVVAAPADIDVQIVHQGRIRRARAPHVVIVPSTVVVTGPRANVDVRGPDVLVVPPSVDVRVSVPGVRIGVYEDDHHHHGKHKHRGHHDNGRHLGWGGGRGRH